jgi:hypothetical protein
MWMWNDPSHIEPLGCIQVQLGREVSTPSCDRDGTWACLLRFNPF